MPYLDIWTISEIFSAVKAALFLRANPDANKTALLNELSIKLDRVPVERQAYVADKLARGETIGAKPKINGSAERKVWNISAILIDAYGENNGVSGFNYFGGFNYQFADVDALAVELAISTRYLLGRVNKGRAAFGKRAEQGEFSASINKKLIERAKNPIKLSAIENSINELDLAEKENRKATRAEPRRNQ